MMLQYAWNLFLNPLRASANKRRWRFYLPQGLNVISCGPALVAMLKNWKRNAITSTPASIRVLHPYPRRYTPAFIAQTLSNSGVACTTVKLTDVEQQLPTLLKQYSFLVMQVDGFHLVMVGLLNGKPYKIDSMHGVSLTNSQWVKLHLTYPVVAAVVK